jgi:peptide/nickel transport system substrate-binding protein
VINLSRPDANALQAWATGPASIVDPEVIEANGGVVANTVNRYMISHAAGSGPFILQSYSPNQRAILVRNPRAIDPPAADRITVNFVNSDPTMLLLARSGKADVTIGMSRKSAASLRNHKLVRLAVNDSELVEQVGLVNTKPPFNNVRFREALTYAVPYQGIVKQVASGYGRLFYGPIQPILPQFNAKLSKPRTYNLAKARTLIRQSGVSVPVSVEMAVQEGNQTELQIATILQAEWRKLGVNVDVRVVAPSAYTTGLRAKAYQSYIRLDGGAVLDAGYFLGYDMICGQPGNRAGICIPAADKMLDKARQTQNPRTRQKQYDEITKLWVKNSPKIMLYSAQNVAVLSKRLRGFIYYHHPDFRNWRPS